MSEVWKPVIHDLRYEVSSLGRLRGPRGITLGSINGRGYRHIRLRPEGIGKTFKVHRLVLLAFVGPSDLCANHKNGIKLDNRLENLEYVTRSENSLHACRTGLNKPILGERHGRSKLTEADVNFVRANYSYKGTWNTCSLARKFKVTSTVIKDILRRKIWAHVAKLEAHLGNKG